MNELDFIKMHGIGNDFVVLDVRGREFRMDPLTARAVADRHTGVGCDQVISMEPSERADIFMRIHNHDGAEVGACGNATRCIGALMFEELGRKEITIETISGLLRAWSAGDGQVRVDMGPARLEWQQIPLAKAMDTLHVDLAIGPKSAPVLSDPVAVNMGNPHAVFFVDEAETVDLATVGPMLENHPLFPERANISVAQILSRDALRLRVWERGAGITQACGSGACAAVVAAARRDLTERRIGIHLDGGWLEVEWMDSGHVEMTGPVATSFTGVLDRSLIAERQDAAA